MPLHRTSLTGWVTLLIVSGMFAFRSIGLAQQPDLLLTTATVAKDTGGRDIAYVAWDSTTPGLLRGKTYALYAKPGGPAAAGAFARQTVLPPPPTAAAIAPLLAQAAQLGFDASSLVESMVGLGAPTTAAPPEQLAALVAAARTNAALESMLELIAKTHPGVELALGRAWLGPIAAGETTFELREYDARTQADLGTVARVTVTAGAVIPLPAPGAPVQVPDLTPSGDLLIKLRWATPPELRRRSAQTRGYNVWRVTKADAERLGWLAQAPSLASLVANAQRVNPAPALTVREFDAASVLNFGDPDAHFVDDNGRFDDPTRAFVDGAEFAYVITSRDLLGRDGAASLAGLGRACHTLPPRVPIGLRVENLHAFASKPGELDHQWFHAEWSANTNPAPDHATHYELFRGTDLKDLETPGGPPIANRIAIVPHAAGQSAFGIDDRSLQPESNFFGKTFWFAIRARRDGACGPVYSAMSPPVFGGLKKFSAPTAPSGEVIGNCPFPIVAWSANRIMDERTPNDGLAHFRVECHRRGPGMLWAEFTVRIAPLNRTLELGRYFFPDELDTLAVDYTLTPPEADNNVELECRVGSAEAQISHTASRPPGRRLFPRVDQVALDTFDAAELTTWDVRPGEPLAAGLFGDIRCFRARYADATGLVVLEAPGLEGRQVAVVARAANGAAGLPERFVTTVIVADGVLTLHDPALVRIDPATVPWTYCGYPISPNFVPGDCPHLARPDGSDRIHHLQVRIRLDPNTREYRLYRRVDDGPLELIAQGAADGSKLPFVVLNDDTMPPQAARICYYAQLLDEHGNASPLALIACRQLTARLPVPLLAAPQSEGDRNAPRMRLDWFCPAAGVDRFEVFLRPVAGSNAPSKFAETLAQTPTSVFNNPAIHVVVSAETKALSKLTADESFVTGRVGGDLGEGPQFQLSVQIENGTSYDVWLKAVGPTGRRGQPSLTQRFAWRPPPPERGRVPWPARPLPPRVPFNALIAATTSIDCPTNRATYPVGVRIGAMPLLPGRQCLPDPGSPIVLSSAAGFNPLVPVDPNQWLFRDQLSKPARTNLTILPAVLYRQQVTNANFPIVTEDVVQCSPLIEKLAWGEVQLTRDTRAAVLFDPFIGVREQPNFGAAQLPGALELILLDTRPALIGARYRYWLAHFGADGEPDGVIPAGEVDVP